MTRELNATAASLLGFLHDAPMSGWDLVVTAQERIGEFWSLTQSQVYRELARMSEEGLVKAGKREARERVPYRITGAGRKAFADWVEQSPAPETIRFPLLLTLAFGRHIPQHLLGSYLAQHRSLHAERLASYEAQRRSMPPDYEDIDPYAVATLDFGINYERAVLHWFDQLPPQITARTENDP